MQLTRLNSNPILTPNVSHEWEGFAAFNGSILKKCDEYHLFYRAISDHCRLEVKELRMSSIGHSVSQGRADTDLTEQFS